MITLTYLQPVQAQKQVCITVDDLPTVSDLYNTGGGQDSLTRRLLTHLQRHRVPAIGFVIAQKLLREANADPKQVSLLTQWLEAGMELGNHTFAHKGYNEISAAEYQHDVLGGERVVKPLTLKYGKPLRYFRHPYLQRGNTVGKLDSLNQYLAKAGYQEAPVTINNRDYLYSAAYDKALALKDTALARSVGRQYVAYMIASVHFYEAQADSLFHRPIAQVLLTHANTINSFFLGDLLARLKAEGYQFVSLGKVLQDPAYQSPDRYIGGYGLSWIQRWALTQGWKETFCDGEPEIPTAIINLADEK